MSTHTLFGQTLRTNRKRNMLRSLTFVRVFFATALLVAGFLELWAGNFFATPFEQLTISAVAGATGVIIAKLAHLV